MKKVRISNNLGRVYKPVMSYKNVRVSQNLVPRSVPNSKVAGDTTRGRTRGLKRK